MFQKIKEIAEYYGYDAQSRQLTEEMAELTQAINKFWRKQLKYGNEELANVPFSTNEELNMAEEMADVEICLEQIKHLLKCRREVNEFKKYKVERELQRIGVVKNED